MKLKVLLIVSVVAVAGVLLYRQYTDFDLSRILTEFKVPGVVEKTQSIPSLSRIRHVFVIVEENHNWREIYQNADAPFINRTLLPSGAYAQNYHNISPALGALHPSEPNYIYSVAGQVAFPDMAFTNDDPPGADNSTASHDHLAYLLDRKNLSWKSYQEDIPGTGCPIREVGNYVPRHNPFVYFQDVSGNPPSAADDYCRSFIRPFTELSGDLASGDLADFIFITPNLQHDMHDGSVRQADDWLARVVPAITGSDTFKKDGALFITWDEGGGDADENDPVGMIILSPFVKPGYTNSLSYDHASLVKTIEEIFNLSPLLGFAADKNTVGLSDFFIPPAAY
jgi:phospholipase C